MANPDVQTISEGTITKIATDVTAGNIRNLSRDTEVFYTYRLTGGDAPTASEMSEEGCLMFMDDGINEEINSSVGIDIYVLASSGEAKIRLDI